MTEKTEEKPVATGIERFKAFDDVANRESEMPDPADFDESRTRLQKMIDALPQRDIIDDGNARRWLERTTRMAISRMELEHGEGNATVGDVHRHVAWHIRRASGIGGSEAATVLKHYRGQRGTFGDAHNLVKEKLLILSPQPSTPEMARGVRAEPWIQKIAHLDGNLKTDEDSLRKLRGFRWDKRPASIGTPDDIVIPADAENPGVNERHLDDYKAPSAAVMEDYENNGVSFDYVCQLHHYGIISMAAGVRFGEMSIKALDPRSFTIERFPVEFDVALAKELASANDRMWNDHVMTGDIPVAPRPDDLDIEDEELINMGVEAAMMKVVADDAKTRHDDLRKRISEVGADWHEVATGKFDLKVASFTRDRAWKEDVLLSLAEQAGVDHHEFEKEDKKKIDEKKVIEILTGIGKAMEEGDTPMPIIERMMDNGIPFNRKLDAGALAERLEEMGVSTVTAMDVRESFRLSTKKKGPEYERLVELRGEVSSMMEHIESAVQENAPRFASEFEPEAEVDPGDLDI